MNWWEISAATILIAGLLGLLVVFAIHVAGIHNERMDRLEKLLAANPEDA